MIDPEVVKALRPYTWAQIEVAAKEALVNVLLGGVRLSINGREIMRVKEADALQIIQVAQRMQQLERGDDGTALVVFGDHHHPGFGRGAFGGGGYGGSGGGWGF